MSYDYSRFAYAYSAPKCTGKLKSTPDYFIVNEHIPFELTGEGEHVWLYVRKRNTNTQWLARQLAKLAGVRRMDVGYSGLKDRNAVTRQWFSILVHPEKEPDWSELESNEIHIEQQLRSQKKLKRGAHDYNEFEIRIDQLDGDPGQLSDRLLKVRSCGVPNYFGQQRFGIDGDNVDKALEMFTNKRKRLAREKRSIYLSAARSWLFNCIVSERIKSGNWNSRLEGDVFMLDGSKVCFPDDQSADLASRLVTDDIHPTAPMWGDGELMSRSLCAELETTVVGQYPDLADGLVAARVEQQRRACRLLVKEMQWTIVRDVLTINFQLPAGAYATSVLREIMLSPNEPPHAKIRP